MPRKDDNAIHYHFCDSCEKPWGHRRSEIDASQEAYEKAHSCPTCGNGPYWANFNTPEEAIEEGNRANAAVNWLDSEADKRGIPMDMARMMVVMGLITPPDDIMLLNKKARDAGKTMQDVINGA